MKPSNLLAGIVLAGLACGTVQAGEKCLCRANGTTFEEGQVACIKLPSGNKLARCERVLNNTSWKMLGDGCPNASLISPSSPAFKTLSAPADRQLKRNSLSQPVQG